MDDQLQIAFQALREDDTSARSHAIRALVALLEQRHKQSQAAAASTPSEPEWVRSALYMALECPFADVRQALKHFLESIGFGDAVNVQPIISSFIYPQQIPPIDPTTSDAAPASDSKEKEGDDEKGNDNDGMDAENAELLRKLYIDIFVHSGRVSHLTRILGCHPTYLERYHNQHSLIMCAHDVGALLPPHRHYIAILTAALMRSSYLASTMRQEFLFHDGTVSWLTGLQAAPKKFTKLAEFATLLTSQPWLVQKTHIATLVSEGGWGISEIIHALIIICNIRASAAIAFGCGVLPEIDMLTAFPQHNIIPTQSKTHTETKTSTDPSLRERETDKIIGALLHSKSKTPEDEPGSESENVDVSTPTDKRLLFDNAGEDARRGSVPNLGEFITAVATTDMPELDAFISGKRVPPVDFDVKARSYTVFRVQDYSWKEHGYSFVSSYLEEAAPVLDEEFDHVFSLTYHRISSHTNIDTAPFREAIWYYVHRVHGMLHEDYDYRNVNLFLNRPLKHFVKKCALSPFAVTHADFADFGIDLRPDEKVHVTLLAAIAAKQALLLYGLHALTLFLRSTRAS